MRIEVMRIQVFEYYSMRYFGVPRAWSLRPSFFHHCSPQRLEEVHFCFCVLYKLVSLFEREARGVCQALPLLGSQCSCVCKRSRNHLALLSYLQML
ncbi:hypothetical protein ACFOPX_03365 [Helicobacter baculiformis]|uniref:Uncharacterized protein n=1 Tax=Helicobacter baculiformis TaxID=427351 RepID=A0ABV7ZK83_9HELI|nr:hypothetical protein [Helicobacter baculiformis]